MEQTAINRSGYRLENRGFSLSPRPLPEREGRVGGSVLEWAMGLLLTAALTVGIALAWGMTVLEHASGMHTLHAGEHEVHSHDHGQGQAP